MNKMNKMYIYIYVTVIQTMYLRRTLLPRKDHRVARPSVFAQERLELFNGKGVFAQYRFL